jgi:hypothetical protein
MSILLGFAMSTDAPSRGSDYIFIVWKSLYDVRPNTHFDLKKIVFNHNPNIFLKLQMRRIILELRPDFFWT